MPTTPSTTTAAAAGNIQAAAEAIQALDAASRRRRRHREGAAPRCGRRRQVVRAWSAWSRRPSPTPTACGSPSPRSPTSRSCPLARRARRGARHREGLPLRLGEVASPSSPRRIVDDVTVVTQVDRDPGADVAWCSGVSHKFGVWGEMAATDSSTSGPAPTVSGRSTCSSSTRPGSCRCTSSPASRARAGRRRRRRRRPAAADRPEREPVARRPRATTPTAPGRRRTRATRRPSLDRPAGRVAADRRAAAAVAGLLRRLGPAGLRRRTRRPVDRAAGDATAPRPTCGPRSPPGSPPCWRSTDSHDPEAPDIDQPLLDGLEQLLAPAARRAASRRSEVDLRRRRRTRWRNRVESSRSDRRSARRRPRDPQPGGRRRHRDGRAPHRGARPCPTASSEASTVDSWQGQTNRITVALHPLSGADRLDDFNSAFGRLAVTCTRATHGLLMVARAGLDDLLDDAPARPGTPFGEPGTRALPRQTHQRILASFTRGRLDLSDEGSD